LANLHTGFHHLAAAGLNRKSGNIRRRALSNTSSEFRKIPLNSGWDIVDDHGNVQPGTEPSAPRVMRVSKELALAKPHSRE